MPREPWRTPTLGTITEINGDATWRIVANPDGIIVQGKPATTADVLKPTGFNIGDAGNDE